MYRQMDGYPDGHGKELGDFLKDMKLCNGFGREQETGKWANGMNCLAAQIVAHFKKEIGQFYLYPAEITASECDADYTYEIFHDSTILVKKCSGSKVTVYAGPWNELSDFIERVYK
jgi:hypothetical protein